ncbi:hypothetical protein BLNAU_4058 [Blattamonas nauphoetae]|uniref:Uncharacterized protein n=1 Tax=Blattamonas nauphoetae TaxID=2049346 RepID=A0ABQ9YB24_9EUKA|nr:hypothetical protein BLNAU_4058 [Blattamonas nauphoetae]
MGQTSSLTFKDPDFSHALNLPDVVVEGVEIGLKPHPLERTIVQNFAFVWSVNLNDGEWKPVSQGCFFVPPPTVIGRRIKLEIHEARYLVGSQPSMKESFPHGKTRRFSFSHRVASIRGRLRKRDQEYFDWLILQSLNTYPSNFAGNLITIPFDDTEGFYLQRQDMVHFDKELSREETIQIGRAISYAYSGVYYPLIDGKGKNKQVDEVDSYKGFGNAIFWRPDKLILASTPLPLGMAHMIDHNLQSRQSEEISPSQSTTPNLTPELSPTTPIESRNDRQELKDDPATTLHNLTDMTALALFFELPSSALLSKAYTYWRRNVDNATALGLASNAILKQFLPFGSYPPHLPLVSRVDEHTSLKQTSKHITEMQHRILRDYKTITMDQDDNVIKFEEEDEMERMRKRKAINEGNQDQDETKPSPSSIPKSDPLPPLPPPDPSSPIRIKSPVLMATPKSQTLHMSMSALSQTPLCHYKPIIHPSKFIFRRHRRFYVVNDSGEQIECDKRGASINAFLPLSDGDDKWIKTEDELKRVKIMSFNHRSTILRHLINNIFTHIPIRIMKLPSAVTSPSSLSHRLITPRNVALTRLNAFENSFKSHYAGNKILICSVLLYGDPSFGGDIRFAQTANLMQMLASVITQSTQISHLLFPDERFRWDRPKTATKFRKVKHLPYPVVLAGDFASSLDSAAMRLIVRGKETSLHPSLSSSGVVPLLLSQPSLNNDEPCVVATQTERRQIASMDATQWSKFKSRLMDELEADKQEEEEEREKWWKEEIARRKRMKDKEEKRMEKARKLEEQKGRPFSTTDLVAHVPKLPSQPLPINPNHHSVSFVFPTPPSSPSNSQSPSSLPLTPPLNPSPSDDILPNRAISPSASLQSQPIVSPLIVQSDAHILNYERFRRTRILDSFMALNRKLLEEGLVTEEEKAERDKQRLDEYDELTDKQNLVDQTRHLQYQSEGEHEKDLIRLAQRNSTVSDVAWDEREDGRSGRRRREEARLRQMTGRWVGDIVFSQEKKSSLSTAVITDVELLELPARPDRATNRRSHSIRHSSISEPPLNNPLSSHILLSLALTHEEIWARHCMFGSPLDKPDLCSQIFFNRSVNFLPFYAKLDWNPMTGVWLKSSESELPILFSSSQHSSPSPSSLHSLSPSPSLRTLASQSGQGAENQRRIVSQSLSRDPSSATFDARRPSPPADPLLTPTRRSPPKSPPMLVPLTAPLPHTPLTPPASPGSSPLFVQTAGVSFAAFSRHPSPTFATPTPSFALIPQQSLSVASSSIESSPFSYPLNIFSSPPSSRCSPDRSTSFNHISLSTNMRSNLDEHTHLILSKPTFRQTQVKHLRKEERTEEEEKRPHQRHFSFTPVLPLPTSGKQLKAPLPYSLPFDAASEPLELTPTRPLQPPHPSHPTFAATFSIPFSLAPALASLVPHHQLSTQFFLEQDRVVGFPSTQIFASRSLHPIAALTPLMFPTVRTDDGWCQLEEWRGEDDQVCPATLHNHGHRPNSVETIPRIPFCAPDTSQSLSSVTESDLKSHRLPEKTEQEESRLSLTRLLVMPTTTRPVSVIFHTFWADGVEVLETARQDLNEVEPTDRHPWCNFSPVQFWL